MREAQRRYYDEAYESVNGTGAGGLASTIYHKALESNFNEDDVFESVLEVGAGHGEHLPFVKHSFSRYFVTDLAADQIDLSLMKQIEKSLNNKSKIIAESADVQELHYQDNEFNRVISTCLFHHLPYPELAFQELRRVTKNQGIISIYIPSDPGFVYRFAQYLGTSFKVKKSLKKIGADFSVGYLRGIEHRNHVLSLENILKDVYSQDLISKTQKPIPYLSWNFSLFSVYNIKVVKPSG